MSDHFSHLLNAARGESPQAVPRPKTDPRLRAAVEVEVAPESDLGSTEATSPAAREAFRAATEAQATAAVPVPHPAGAIGVTGENGSDSAGDSTVGSGVRATARDSRDSSPRARAATSSGVFAPSMLRRSEQQTPKTSGASAGASSPRDRGGEYGHLGWARSAPRREASHPDPSRPDQAFGVQPARGVATESTEGSQRDVGRAGDAPIMVSPASATPEATPRREVPPGAASTTAVLATAAQSTAGTLAAASTSAEPASRRPSLAGSAPVDSAGQADSLVNRLPAVAHAVPLPSRIEPPWGADVTGRASHADDTTVHVHIDRVEVRAAPPAPAPATKRPRLSGPRMSLTDYLEARR